MLRKKLGSIFLFFMFVLEWYKTIEPAWLVQCQQHQNEADF